MGSKIEAFLDRYSAALIALAIMLLAVPLVAFAQDAPAPSDGSLLAIVKGILALPAVSVAVLALLKHGVSSIPNRYLPYIAPFVALVAQVFGQLVLDVNLTNASDPAVGAAQAFFLGGSAGVGWHQLAGAPRTAAEEDALRAENERLKAELKRTKAR